MYILFSSSCICFLFMQLLEQMPRVVSSLDAHMENGLQRLYSSSLSFAKPSLACSFYAMPKATLVQ